MPARFGPSDAAEWFVFCSGFASAVAFGGVFARRGFALGTARVLFRCWQIYWAQIGLFLAVAATVAAGNLVFERDYVGQLNLHYFFGDPVRGLFGLFTLTYVPNYFDILPMYLAILLMLPALMALRRLHPYAALLAPPLLWAANRALGFDLPAEWWSQRSWFFNPFAWQLLFFTGFAFAAGWLKPPPPERRLIALAGEYVLLMVAMNWSPIWANVEIVGRVSTALLWGFQETDFGILRYLHFLAIAYLLRCAFMGRMDLLHTAPFAVLRRIGQQALAVFVTSMVLARVAGMAMDEFGRGPGVTAAVNLTGFAILALTAYTVGWFKAEPWRRPAPETATPEQPELRAERTR
jgi:hypothetical protein